VIEFDPETPFWESLSFWFHCSPSPGHPYVLRDYHLTGNWNSHVRMRTPG